MHKRFEKKTHATLYRLHRPKTPEFVVEDIVRYVKEKRPPHLAINVGCGSGQNTFVFAKYFDEVIGTDISPAQLEEAEVELQCQGSKNVRFVVSPAVDMSTIVNDHSVDLVVGAACFHWLNLTKFYVEARRILVPNGTIAAICQLPGQLYHPTDENRMELLNKVNRDMFNMYSSKCPPAVTDIVDNLYNHMPFPFHHIIRNDPVPLKLQLSLTEWLCYISTWSAFQTLPVDEAAVIRESLQNDMLRLYDYPVTTDPDVAGVHVELTYFYLMGRVE